MKTKGIEYTKNDYQITSLSMESKSREDEKWIPNHYLDIREPNDRIHLKEEDSSH